MEKLGTRPIWSMSGSELMHAVDRVDAEIAQRETYRLQLIAALDSIGYAQEVGARDTAQLLEFRYRLDRYRANRDVRLARALHKYPAVSSALPDLDPTDDSAGDTGSEAGVLEVRLRQAQAEAIVFALEKVPDTVPADDIEVAERELVRLARHLPPAELRKAATQARDILDTDGPEPEEQKAYARESLTLTNADRGVKFKGYLANENAELFRSMIFAGARPYKTLDGEPDPRSRDKRQADALATALTLAATALDAGTPSPTIPRPTTTPNPNSAAPTVSTTPSPYDDTRRDPPARASRRAGRTAAAATASDSAGSRTNPGAAAPDPRAAADSPAARRQAHAPDTASGTAMSGKKPATAAADAATGADTPDTNAHAPDTGSGSARPCEQPGAIVTDPGADTSAARHRAHAPGTEDGSDCPGVRHGVDVSGAGDGAVVPGFGAKANITVTIDLQDLKAATADAIGQTVYGDGLSAATIRRLACDAKIIPLVLGSNSEPLDVGRCERLVTRAMRRALNARDRGCVVCGAPPIMCDAHHLISWIDGGTTAVSNLALVCRRHHTDVHNGQWTITITAGQVEVSRPAWADPPRPQPSRPKPPTAHAPPPAAPRSDEYAALEGTSAEDPALKDSSTECACRDTEAVGALPSDRSAARAAVAAAVMRRSALGRELLRRVPSADGDHQDPTPTSLREAAYQAIWGEATAPSPDRRTDSRRHVSSARSGTDAFSDLPTNPPPQPPTNQPSEPSSDPSRQCSSDIPSATSAAPPPAPSAEAARVGPRLPS